jgi:hypothetical protein
MILILPVRAFEDGTGNPGLLTKTRYFLDNRRVFCIIAVYFSIIPGFPGRGNH